MRFCVALFGDIYIHRELTECSYLPATENDQKLAREFYSFCKSLLAKLIKSK